MYNKIFFKENGKGIKKFMFNTIFMMFFFDSFIPWYKIIIL